MTRLLLVRHAEPDESVRGQVYGRLDPPLSPAGRAHAEALAAVLGAEAPRAVYASPQLRARETADALGIEPVLCDGLREVDFGELEGLLVADAVERFPEVAGWTAAPAGAVFPGGESIVSVRDRVLAATARIVAAHAGETVAVFSHSVPIRIVLADALGLELDALFRFDVGYGRISVVEWFDGAPFVRVVNAAHL